MPPYNLPYTRMAKWQAVYGVAIFKVAQNVTKVKISSPWHLEDKIPELMMLEICCCHLSIFLYTFVTFCVILKIVMLYGLPFGCMRIKQAIRQHGF